MKLCRELFTYGDLNWPVITIRSGVATNSLKYWMSVK